MTRLGSAEGLGLIVNEEKCIFVMGGKLKGPSMASN